MQTDMPITERQFIRHPSNIPLEYCITSEPICNTNAVCNISEGGLSFHSTEFISPNKWLHLYIPLNENYFETDAQVRWCKKMEEAASSDQHYNIGVSFCSDDMAFSARMVEQVCYIEEYKQRVKDQEGRTLNSDQAAAEWIEKYADTFPNFCE